MKKIFYIAVFALLSFVMISCSKNYSFSLTASVSELRNGAVVSYTIVDPNKELKSSKIIASATEKDGKTNIYSKEIQYNSAKLSDEVTITGLESGKEYTVKFTVGYDGKEIELATKNFTTLTEGNSSETPYLISTLDEFKTKIKNDPSGHFKLGADIDFNGESISPLFTNTTPFVGTFDGDNHKLYNFTLGSLESLSSISYKYYGLFGYVGAAGVIKNVTLDAFNLYILRSSSTTFVGLVAGYNEGTISNVNVTNSVLYLDISSSSSSNGSDSSGNLTGYYAAGLVGYNKNGGKIENSTVNADITVKAKRGVIVGGICAVNFDNSNFDKTNVIDGCKFNGNLTVTVSSTSDAAYESTTSVGGIIGQNFYTVSNCEVSGTVTLTSSFKRPSSTTYRVHFGGLVGWNISDVAVVKNSKVSASLKVESKDALELYAGLLAGQNGGLSSPNRSKVVECTYTLPENGTCEATVFEGKAKVDLIGLDKNPSESNGVTNEGGVNVTVNTYHKTKDADDKDVVALKETTTKNIN